MTRMKLLEDELLPDPFAQFDRWFREAQTAQPSFHEAMTLATADSNGAVSARMVLLKGVDARGFAFYTNYASRKALQIHDNPQAALVFFWPVLERQVRVEGAVVRVTEEESDAYFASRPRGSQLGAWASDQSTVLTGRGDLDERFAKMEESYGNRPIPRPPHWGGYRVIPVQVEFWQGRPDRLHDRFLYRLREPHDWIIERLAP